jgi:hypothetical protein
MAALCMALLAWPIHLPIGAMHWDLVLYIDAAHRFAAGQRPHVDFFLPVGPLSYWLFWLVSAVFPRSNPLLAAQWAPMLLTVPAMALVVGPLARRAPALALGLTLPFLLFHFAPLNTDAPTVAPSVDGYGIYNRNASMLLYVLAAALLFPPGRRRVVLLAALLLTALFLTKITAFLAGGALCAFAMIAGRIGWREAAASAALALAVLGLLQASTGLVLNYVDDIRLMISLNQGGMARRALGTGSGHVVLLVAAMLLVLVSLVAAQPPIAQTLRAVWRRDPGAISRLGDQPALWLAAALVAGFVYETQNVGSQAFIFLWPAMMAVGHQCWQQQSRLKWAALALIGFAAIPAVNSVLSRGVRATLASAVHRPLEHVHLGRLGLVSQHPESLTRARAMLGIYAGHLPTQEALAAQEMLPAPALYSDHEYQLSWLMAADEGVSAILQFEAAQAVRFETLMPLNFANPFPALMGRGAVAHVAIGADPWRAVPPPDATTIANLQAADLVLEPLCPLTVATLALKRIYEPALHGRKVVQLGRCWLGHVRPGLLP